jgi:hypothetical protein
LPIRGHAASRSPDELAAQYQQLFQQLADDLQNVLRDSQFVDDFLARNRPGDPARP